MMLSTLCIIVAVFVIIVTQWVYRWRNPKCNGKVPPGSMGLPLVGETIQFVTSSTSFEILPFIKTRMERYGPIFKSHLMGAPFIVSTDPELNSYVFQQDDRLFENGYPDTVQKSFGQQQVGSLHVTVYKYLKRMVLSTIGPESLKTMLPEFEQTIRTKLEQWSCQDTTELKEATSEVSGVCHTSKILMSFDPNNSSDNLKANFDAFILGIFTFPIPFPGTAFSKCLQGRKNVMRTLKDLVQKRRANPREQPVDFLDQVLVELNKEGAVLTDAIAYDILFLLLLTSSDSTSALTLLLNFVSDHPLVLEQLTEEHELIVKRRENANSGLTWDECKSMKFTMQVINETLRLINLAPGMIRKAVKEVQFKGYTIPEGWSVMVCTQPQHLNPEKYKDPMAFNPWRWEGKDNGSSKDFMPFGGGLRSCVGAAYAKFLIAVFLHCLVTKYRWEVLKGGNIFRNPLIQFPDGFRVRILKKETTVDNM